MDPEPPESRKYLGGALGVFVAVILLIIVASTWYYWTHFR